MLSNNVIRLTMPWCGIAVLFLQIEIIFISQKPVESVASTIHCPKLQTTIQGCLTLNMYMCFDDSSSGFAN